MIARNPWFRLDRHDEDPAPGASETESTTQDTPSPALLAARAAAQQADPAPFDPSSLAPEVRAYLEAQIKDADRKARVTSKANAAAEARDAARIEARQEMAAQVAKALGLSEEVDPEETVNQLAAQVGEYHDTLWQMSVNATVRAAAAKLGANAEMLLDSNAFFSTLDAHVDDDPRDPAFAALVETRVEEALARDPARYKTVAATPAGPPAPRPDRSQGRGASNDAPNFRTMPRAEVDAELAKFGFRQRS